MCAVALAAVFSLMAGMQKPARADEPAKATVEGAYPGLATGVLKLAIIDGHGKRHPSEGLSD